MCFFLVSPTFISFAIGSEGNEEKVTATKHFRQAFKIDYNDKFSHISLSTLQEILAIPACPSNSPAKDVNLRKFAIVSAENYSVVCQYHSHSINKMTDIEAGTFRLTNPEGDSIYNATVFKFAFEPTNQDHKAQETKTFSITVMNSTPQIEEALKNKLIPTLKLENNASPLVQAGLVSRNNSSSPTPRLPNKTVNFNGLSSPSQTTSNNTVPKLGPLKGALKKPLPPYIPISSPKKIMDASYSIAKANLAPPKPYLIPPPVPPRSTTPKK